VRSRNREGVEGGTDHKSASLRNLNPGKTPPVTRHRPLSDTSAAGGRSLWGPPGLGGGPPSAVPQKLSLADIAGLPPIAASSELRIALTNGIWLTANPMARRSRRTPEGNQNPWSACAR
jgi:hypothetical protein